MKPEDGKRFSAVMQALASCYGKDLSPMMIELYWRSMPELTIEQVEAAAAKILRDPEQKFWPRPADFIERTMAAAREKRIAETSREYIGVRERPALSDEARAAIRRRAGR